MKAADILNIFKKTGGYITNSHIVYTSGKHGEVYLNKDAIYRHTTEISKICKEIAKKFSKKKIEAVVAPALGGIVLSQWVSYHLKKLTKKNVLALYTEKNEESDQVFKRGHDKMVFGKRTLVVEDITTTGGSVKKTMARVTEAGGKIIAVCVLVNRNDKEINTKSMGAPFYSLVNLNIAAWDEKDCPLCKSGVPINTTVGHGKMYLEKRNKQDGKQ